MAGLVAPETESLFYMFLPFLESHSPSAKIEESVHGIGLERGVYRGNFTPFFFLGSPLSLLEIAFHFR